jgi:hypothetical protein
LGRSIEEAKTAARWVSIAPARPRQRLAIGDDGSFDLALR